MTKDESFIKEKINISNTKLSGITLVDRIDELAKLKGITRKDLSKNIGRNPSTIATWKTRNIIPPADILYEIANYFNVTIDYLLTGNIFNNDKMVKKNMETILFNYIEEIEKNISFIKTYLKN